ncbi:MAG: transglutaminase domain-containing protein [Oscillospiraceae bacterium]
MMKKTMAGFLGAALLWGALAGCGTGAPVPTDSPDDIPMPTQSAPPADYVYNADAIDSYTRTYIQPDPALYQQAFDGVEQFESTVPLGEQTYTEEQVAAVAAAVFSRYEFDYLNGMRLSKDGKNLEIFYLDGYTAETATTTRDAFRRKVQYILSDVADPEKTDVENAQAVYRYFAKATYNENAKNAGCYGIMVSGEGICTGYAYAMRYIFDQLGIPSHLAFSKDQSHVWNVVELDGKWYHLDATWESIRQDETPQLYYFGMTDQRRGMDFDGWYGGGHSDYDTYQLPPCTDGRFQSLWDTGKAEGSNP